MVEKRDLRSILSPNNYLVKARAISGLVDKEMLGLASSFIRERLIGGAVPKRILRPRTIFQKGYEGSCTGHSWEMITVFQLHVRTSMPVEVDGSYGWYRHSREPFMPE